IPLRRGDRDQLHLVELVLAKHAARVPPGRPRLGAKTRRQRREAERQRVLLENGLADEIRERDFGGGDEPKLLDGSGRFYQFIDESFRAIAQSLRSLVE